jgi:pimeloyl-ACP methyl ester carboxylesterase
MKAERFEIHVAEDDLDDLRRRLEHFRPAPDFANEDWRYGTPSAYLETLVRTWLEDYDWRAAEAEMNRFSHARVRIEGVPIHFLERRGVGPRPMPLILTHGWPWTFWDYRYVIDPLADPGSHGGDPEDAFDVIVPSLPGFVFSSPLTQTGVNWIRTADLWVVLMRDVLGYERFGAAGGDWGAFVTAQLGHKYAPLLYGVHETFPAIPGLDYASVGESDYAEDERSLYLQRLGSEARTVSHMTVHSTDPQTLAQALHDSPAGLASWIVERRRNWSDCDGDVERAFTREHLLTTFSLFWLTGTIGSSLRFYWETAHQPWRPAHDRRPTIEAPTGIAQLPRDVFPLPKRVIERHADLRQWSLLERGGHFGPAEAPELVVEDIRRFFRPLREA